MGEGQIEYRLGIPEVLRSEAGELYDEAFGAKFAVAVRTERFEPLRGILGFGASTMMEYRISDAA